MARKKRMLRCLRSKVRMTSVSWVFKVYTHLKFLCVKEDKEIRVFSSSTIIPQKESHGHSVYDQCFLGIEKAGLGLQLSGRELS